MAGAPQGGQTAMPNVNQAAAMGIYGSGLGAAGEMGYRPMGVGAQNVAGTSYQAPTISGVSPISAQDVQAGQLAQTGLSPYMNPYTEEVIRANEADILRGAQMGLNTLGAQAQAARAYGGSRQGVAEGVLAGEYGRMAGDIAAQQRQAGYTQALDAAMRDRAARAGYAQQLAGLGQQAFQTGQTIQQQQAQQGLLQQGLQQALIDAARQQYQGYVGSPQQALQAPLAALGVVPVPQSTTKSKQPGFFDYATLAATAAAGM